MLKKRHIRDGIYQGEDGFQYYSFRFDQTKHQGPTGYESRKKALEFKKDLIEKLSRQKAGLEAPDAPTLTVEQLWKNWKAEAGREVSAAHLNRVSRDWELHILPVFGKDDFSQVTTARVRKLRADYLDQPSMRNLHFKNPRKTPRPIGKRSTVGANHVMTHLHLVFGWALDTELITFIPFHVKALGEQEPVRHFLRLEDVDPFLEALDRITQAGAAKKAGKEPKAPTDALHVRVAVRMMLYLLLREEDAVGMKWRWFSRGFKAYTPGDTKGGEAVTLSVPALIRPLLTQLKERAAKEKERTGKDCPWVIPAVDGEPHRPQFTRKAIAAAGRAIGIVDLTPHRMRGTGATLMARAKVNAFVIQKAGRWKNVATVERYIRIIEEDVKQAQAQAFNLSPTGVPQKKKALELKLKQRLKMALRSHNP